MNNPDAFFVVTRYDEDISWIDKYTDKYLVYNKGHPIIGNKRIKNVDNLGMNQRDIFKFAYENYDNLPKLTAFLQAEPFIHCPIETFDNLIYSKSFTPLEYFTHNMREDGGYREANGLRWNCKYEMVDNFMNYYFADYIHPIHVDICCGSQYIVEDFRILYYPKSFWKSVMEELSEEKPLLGHLIERCLMMIFKNTYRIKNNYE